MKVLQNKKNLNESFKIKKYYKVTLFHAEELSDYYFSLEKYNISSCGLINSYFFFFFIVKIRNFTDRTAKQNRSWIAPAINKIQRPDYVHFDSPEALKLTDGCFRAVLYVFR